MTELAESLLLAKWGPNFELPFFFFFFFYKTDCLGANISANERERFTYLQG